MTRRPLMPNWLKPLKLSQTWRPIWVLDFPLGQAWNHMSLFFEMAMKTLEQLPSLVLFGLQFKWRHPVLDSRKWSCFFLFFFNVWFVIHEGCLLWFYLVDRTIFSYIWIINRYLLFLTFLRRPFQHQEWFHLESARICTKGLYLPNCGANILYPDVKS